MTTTLDKLHAQRVKAREQGFTLVELAIVLVIIGLIVGGVLVGQDLIKAAEIRATVTDLENFNSSATTFRTKYGGYPGDLLSTRATQFGMTARSGANGRGDGDGLLEAAAQAAGTAGFETVLFWRDLSFAGLLNDSFTTATDATTTGADVVPNLFPNVAVRETAYAHIYASTGRNYYTLTNPTLGAAGLVTIGATLTPLEAFQIDEKVDDSFPVTGSTVALTAADTPAITTTDDPCVDGTVAGDPYNTLTEAEASAISCSIRIRAGF